MNVFKLPPVKDFHIVKGTNDAKGENWVLYELGCGRILCVNSTAVHIFSCISPESRWRVQPSRNADAPPMGCG